MYWLELLDESGTLKADATRVLKSEADELVAILATCSNKARKKTRTKNEG